MLELGALKLDTVRLVQPRPTKQANVNFYGRLPDNLQITGTYEVCLICITTNRPRSGLPTTNRPMQCISLPPTKYLYMQLARAVLDSVSSALSNTKPVGLNIQIDAPLITDESIFPSCQGAYSTCGKRGINRKKSIINLPADGTSPRRLSGSFEATAPKEMMASSNRALSRHDLVKQLSLYLYFFRSTLLFPTLKSLFLPCLKRPTNANRLSWHSNI